MDVLMENYSWATLASYNAAFKPVKQSEKKKKKPFYNAGLWCKALLNHLISEHK